MSNTELNTLLEAVASQIRQELVSRTGSISLKACHLHRTYVPGPPLDTPMDFLGVRLDSLGRICSRVPVLTEHLEHAYEILLGIRHGNRTDSISRIQHCLKQATPTLSIRSPEGWLMDLLLVFSIAGQAPDNDFEFNHGSITVRVAGKSYRFLGGSVDGPGGYRVLRVKPDFPLSLVLRRSIHSGVFTSAAMGGLYRWLLRQYPTCTTQIDWIVGAACLADQEKVFTQGLDVEVVTVPPKKPELLVATTMSLSRISNASTFNLNTVSGPLREVLSEDRIRHIFLVPTPPGRTYTDARKALHRHRLMEIEYDFIESLMGDPLNESTVAVALMKEIR